MNGILFFNIMGKQFTLLVFFMILFLLSERCQTAIILNEVNDTCRFIECESGRSPIGDDCICECPLGRYGHFCEHEETFEFPGGSYLLPKPIYGCPVNSFSSSSLAVTFPPNSDDVMDWFLKSSNLIGPAIGVFGGFRFHFCHAPDNVEEDPSWWMPGKYCLFQKGDNPCPYDFQLSRLMVNSSYRIETRNFTVHTWPNITVDASGNHSVGVCCRDDSLGLPILMHHFSPFYLLKSPGASECQPLMFMEAQEEEVELFHWANGVNLTLCLYIPNPSECVHQGDGNDYVGKRAVTMSNTPCIPWDQVADPTYVTNQPDFYTENYCRAIDSNIQCYISPYEREKCSIPFCRMAQSNRGLTSYAEFNYQSLNKMSFYSFKDLEPISWLQVDYDFTRKVTHFWIEPQIMKPIKQDLYVVIYVTKGPFDFMDKSAEACRKEFNLKLANTLVDECYRPMFGRYFTVVKQRGSGNLKDLLQVTISINDEGQCGKNLGLTTGRILDDQVIVSSQTVDFNSDTVGLNSAGWCADKNDDKPFVQIDLIIPMIVEGLWMDTVIFNREEWYMSIFTVQYGISLDKLKYVTEDGGKIIYFSYKPRVISERLYILPHSLVTRYIRIDVLVYTGQPCLKLELTGCLRNVLRDVNCAEGSDFIGHGITQGKKLDLPVADFERSVTVESVTDCLKKCDENQQTCKSILYNNGSCLLRTPHRYNHHFLQKMVSTSESHFYGQRLCVKDINNQNQYTATITQPGIVSSPSYPMYDIGITWNLRVRLPKGTFAVMTILDMSLSRSPRVNGIDLNNDQNLEWLIGNPRSVEEGTDRFEISNPGLTRTRVIYINHDVHRQFTGVVFRSLNNEFDLKLTTSYSSLPAPSRGLMINISLAEDNCGGCNYVQDHMCQGDVSPDCQQSCGYLSSMYHPQPVSKDGLFCPWTIKAPSFIRDYVQLEFVEFSMHTYNEKSTCELSSVTVYDTDYNRNKIKIGKYCSLNPPPKFVYSRWGEMTVEYSKTKSTKTENTGFLLKYSIKTNTAQPPTSDNCDADWFNHDGGCYRLFVSREGMTWFQARDECQQHGGSLVNIESHQEMMFVYSLFVFTEDLLVNQDVYIGLRKIDGEFRWTNGNPMIYTSWEEKQPDGVGTENCVLINVQSSKFSKSWRDISCAFNSVFQFICEVPNSRNNTQSTMEASTLVTKLFTIPSTTHQCNNGEYISSLAVCDNIVDCYDASDEEGCDYTLCNESSYTCGNGRCIPLIFYCDFKDDCGDGSDETRCVPRNCTSEEWKCKNGECIDENKHCNMIVDCLDATDETVCDSCSKDSFQCYDGRCISQSMYCDGQVDCSGNFREDEPTGCLKNVYHTCGDYYRDGYRASGTYSVLNMDVECDFLSDSEFIRNIFHHTEEGLLLKTTFGPSSLSLLGNWTISDIMDRYSNCEHYLRIECLYNQNSDERLLFFASFSRLFALNEVTEGNCSCLFKDSCQNGQSRCACTRPITYWYNHDEFQYDVLEGYFQKPIKGFINNYASDADSGLTIERGPIVCKEERRASEAILCHDGILVSGTEKCLLKPSQSGKMNGCRDFTHLLACEKFECPSGYLKCDESYCLHISLVCNGKTDCYDGQDEDNIFCGNWTCPGYYRCKDSTICLEMDQVCDGNNNCPEADDEYMCNFECPPFCRCNAGKVTCHLQNQQTIPNTLPVSTKSLNVNNNRLNLTEFNLERFTLLGELHLSSTGLEGIPAYTFKHQVNLYHLDLSHNKLLTLLPGAFVGLVKLQVLNLIGNTHLKTIEPGAFEDLFSLPVLYLDGTALTSLRASTFQGLDILEELYVTNGSLQSVADGAFESLVSLKRLDIRNQDIETFSGGLFNGLDTLEYLYTDSYRFCCVKPESVADDNCEPEADEFSSCTDLMRRETLRLFMWILGLIAVLGNFLTILYRILFDRAGFKRGYGIFVTNLGISDFLMGVYMLIIASADAMFRGRYIWNDSWWRHSSYCQLAGVLTTVSSEASALFLCMITLDRFLIIKYPFGQYKFTRRSSLIAVSIVWMFSILMGLIPILPGTGFTGRLYSRTGICLALPLTRDRTPGWQFSTGLFIFFNFVTFLLICLGQIAMYRSMVKSGSVVQSKERRGRDIEVARRLSLIVLTDFVCWFPICCMGLMTLNNVVINSEVYAWTAVFILPINSALNPLLYTISSILGKTKASKKKLNNRASASVDSSSSTLIKSMTNLWKNEHLQFGPIDDTIFIRLGSVSASRSFSPHEMLWISKKVIRAMAVVHHENLVVGGLHESDILLQVENKEIQTVKLVGRILLPDQSVNQPEDIYSFGKMVAKLLRNYASQKI